ncbi:hypothetical protein [Kitasatospora cinereorecta]|uniref:Cytochrome P450 n=1 Tax=Kitasatospora cinereorecta TaxID=285560 RepID=A0ABW0VK99_9ACTN
MPLTGPPPSLPPEPVRLDEAFLDDPHAAYAGLHRRGGAVHRAVAPDECPVSLVTGYRAVHAAAADGRLALDKRHARSRGTAGDSLPPELDAHLLNSDGADHARLRRLTAAALGPRRIAALRPASGRPSTVSSTRSRPGVRAIWSVSSPTRSRSP